MKPTVGLQVFHVWKAPALSPQGQQRDPHLCSLIEFWEVTNLLLDCFAYRAITLIILQVGAANRSSTAALREAAQHSSAATLVVFSMTDKGGFDQLPSLLTQLATSPCIVVATKCDLVQSWAVTLVRQQIFNLHQTCLVHSAAG